MKHFVAITIMVAMLGSHEVYSQFSLNAGLSLSKWEGDDIVGTVKSRPGFHLGFNYQVVSSSSNSVRFSPGLRYHQKGTRIETVDVFEGFPGQQIRNEVTVSSKLNYLEIPLKFSFQLMDNLFAICEPSISILLNDDHKFTNVMCLDGNCTGFSESFDAPINDSEISIGIGLGYRIFSKTELLLTYQLGQSQLVSDVDAKNRTLMISTQIRF
ncbi:outer membrane beta-barrel protein [Ekhidna sp.]|uniref:outer membrane beta-barrel protein n=1 Tax=Ekhidna sp. TaxID=2608089 RepID=UPI003299FC95